MAKTFHFREHGAKNIVEIERLRDGWATPADALAKFSRRHRLTPAETAVAGLLAQAHSAAEIAKLLGVSVYTVRAHVRGIYSKIGINRQAALIRLILEASDEFEEQDAKSIVPSQS